MQTELSALFQKLAVLRQNANLTAEEVEAKLILGPGWVAKFESGEVEPTFGTLSALLNLYGTDLTRFFSSLKFKNTGLRIVDRHLSAEETGNDLTLHFPMGTHNSSLVIKDADLTSYEEILKPLRAQLAAGQKKVAVVETFLTAVAQWPHANPSDLWYFLVAHSYQDKFNHPATSANADLAQSWKRTGGWSLEAIYVDHYNKYLKTQGIRLDMPSPDQKKKYLTEMGISSNAAVEKSDVLVIGTSRSGDEHPFGVVHVKASFAERRTDDAPLSAELMRGNYVSPLLTMDCKATPKPQPVNSGELGDVQGGTNIVSSKRLDIERDRIFDAAFSYNARTRPTPTDANAAARIHVCNFKNPNDAFAQHLIRKWNDRQGH